MQHLLPNILQGDIKSLARAISLVENEVEGYEEFLSSLPSTRSTKIIGITGAPGAGKSTLVDALIGEMVKQGKRVGVLCIDPSSPFNLGALLGDRIRMSNWYNHPNVFIRSLATRGSMGGLHPKIIEIAEVMKAAPFDFIVIETVGVGQTEVEIAGLADTTVVVVVPEGGDEVQTMKAGLMEVADIFVVNKGDRPGADIFVKNLQQMLAPVFSTGDHEIPIVKTVATTGEGINDLYKAVDVAEDKTSMDQKVWLLTERAYLLIQRERMRSISKKKLWEEIATEVQSTNFNLYRFMKTFMNENRV